MLGGLPTAVLPNMVVVPALFLRYGAAGRAPSPLHSTGDLTLD
jgi:hypothetical protein